MNRQLAATCAAALVFATPALALAQASAAQSASRSGGSTDQTVERMPGSSDQVVAQSKSMVPPPPVAAAASPSRGKSSSLCDPSAIGGSGSDKVQAGGTASGSASVAAMACNGKAMSPNTSSTSPQ